jgi:hypothetical protein
VKSFTPLVIGLGAFLTLIWITWGTPVTGVDGIHYISSGLHLLREGQYLDPAGAAELWFPPVYPLLIATLSGGGRFDPVIVARAISVVASLGTIILVWWVCRPFSPQVAGVAVALLALNPLFERQALAVLAEATATALMFSAFVLWLVWSGRSVSRGAAIGALIGLSYLTRPEALIVLMLWTVIDGWTWPHKQTLVSYIVAWTVVVLIAAPYVIFLQRHTGHFAASNKLGITLASGRAVYYDCPREYIDPETLQMTIYPCPVSWQQEAQRYVTNLASIVRTQYMSAFFGRTMPVAVPVGFLLMLGLGAIHLGRTHPRLLAGLLAQFGAIPIMAALDVKSRYLHMSLPACMILISAAVAYLTASASARRYPVRSRLFGAFAFLQIALFAMGPVLTRTPGGRDPVALLSREMGMAAQNLPSGVMYEAATSLAYYAQMKRVELPLNDLETFVRYVREQHKEPVYLVVSTVARHDPSVAALLTGSSPLVTRVQVGRREDVTVGVFAVR